MIFVVVDEEIDDFGPVLKGFAGADEEILFVEYVKDLVFELFSEDGLLLQQT